MNEFARIMPMLYIACLTNNEESIDFVLLERIRKQCCVKLMHICDEMGNNPMHLYLLSLQNDESGENSSGNGANRTQNSQNVNVVDVIVGLKEMCLDWLHTTNEKKELPITLAIRFRQINGLFALISENNNENKALAPLLMILYENDTIMKTLSEWIADLVSIKVRNECVTSLAGSKVLTVDTKDIGMRYKLDSNDALSILVNIFVKTEQLANIGTLIQSKVFDHLKERNAAYCIVFLSNMYKLELAESDDDAVCVYFLLFLSLHETYVFTHN